MSNNPGSRLLNLPAEIRIDVLRHALISSRPLTFLNDCTSAARFGTVKFWRHLQYEQQQGYLCHMHKDLDSDTIETMKAMFLTCRQVYQESRMVFFGENEWNVGQVNGFVHHLIRGPFNKGLTPRKMRFTKGIPPKNASLIRHISTDRTYLAVPWGGNWTCFHQFAYALDCFTGLQHLELSGAVPWTDLITSPYYAAQRRFDELPLVMLAAHVTAYHPYLKKAIWHCKVLREKAHYGKLAQPYDTFVHVVPEGALSPVNPKKTAFDEEALKTVLFTEVSFLFSYTECVSRESC